MSARAAALLGIGALACSEIAGVRQLSTADAAAQVDAAADASADGGASALTTLATVPDQGDVSLAADGERVFVAVAGSQILAVPVAGGTLTSLKVTPSQAIAVDAHDLYFASGPAIRRCPGKSCGLTQAVADGQLSPSSLAIVAGDVYFLDGGRVLRAAASADAAAVQIALDERPVDFAVDEAGLTFTRASGVFRCPAGGCGAGGTPTQIATASAAGSLAIAGPDVVWIDGTRLRRASLSVPPGDAQDLATTGNDARSVVVGATRIYWREGNLRVAACPRAGGVPTTMAEGDAAPASDLAADATALYWTTAARKLMRLAR